jgi:hypothetical protein
MPAPHEKRPADSDGTHHLKPCHKRALLESLSFSHSNPKNAAIAAAAPYADIAANDSPSTTASCALRLALNASLHQRCQSEWLMLPFLQTRIVALRTVCDEVSSKLAFFQRQHLQPQRMLMLRSSSVSTCRYTSSRLQSAHGVALVAPRACPLVIGTKCDNLNL